MFAVSWGVAIFQGPQQTQPKRLDTSTIDVLRKNLKKLTDDKMCGKFLDAVIKALPPGWSFGNLNATKFTGSISDNLERVLNAGGLWVQENLGADAVFRAGKITFNAGSLKLTDNRIAFLFNEGGQMSMVSTMPSDLKNSTATESLETTFTLIHELVHAYLDPVTTPNCMSHPQMDQAAEAAMKNLGIQPKSAYKENPDGKYFDALLRQMCGGVKL